MMRNAELADQYLAITGKFAAILGKVIEGGVCTDEHRLGLDRADQERIDFVRTRLTT